MSGGEPSSIKREFPCAARQPVPWLPPEDFLFFRERKGSKRKLTRRGFRRLQNLSAPDAFYGRLSFSFFTTPFSEGRASQRSSRLSQSGGEKAAGNREDLGYVRFFIGHPCGRWADYGGKPQTFFDITESWKSNAEREPSDLYRIGTRLGGILFLLVGVAGMIVLGALCR